MIKKAMHYGMSEHKADEIKLRISESALKQMAALENDWKKRIGRRIQELAVTPRQSKQSIKLKGEDNLLSQPKLVTIGLSM